MAEKTSNRSQIPKADLDSLIEKALKDESMPEIHFNGFINAIGSGDILIILQRNGRAIAKLNTSYTVAKTLSQKLGSLVVDLEQRTGNTIMTVDDINQALSKQETSDESNQ